MLDRNNRIHFPYLIGGIGGKKKRKSSYFFKDSGISTHVHFFSTRYLDYRKYSPSRYIKMVYSPDGIEQNPYNPKSPDSHLLLDDPLDLTSLEVPSLDPAAQYADLYDVNIVDHITKKTRVFLNQSLKYVGDVTAQEVWDLVYMKDRAEGMSHTFAVTDANINAWAAGTVAQIVVITLISVVVTEVMAAGYIVEEEAIFTDAFIQEDGQFVGACRYAGNISESGGALEVEEGAMEASEEIGGGVSGNNTSHVIAEYEPAESAEIGNNEISSQNGYVQYEQGEELDATIEGKYSNSTNANPIPRSTLDNASEGTSSEINETFEEIGQEEPPGLTEADLNARVGQFTNRNAPLRPDEIKDIYGGHSTPFDPITFNPLGQGGG